MDKEGGNFWSATCDSWTNEVCDSYSVNINDELLTHNNLWNELSNEEALEDIFFPESN